MEKKFEIRNSTAEFLTFVAEGKEQGIQVLYKDETVWATQKAMAQLFDCSTDNIGLHLKNIYDTNELNKEAYTQFPAKANVFFHTLNLQRSIEKISTTRADDDMELGLME